MSTEKIKKLNAHGHVNPKEALSMMLALNIDFQVITSHNHEQEPHTTPENCVCKHARAKERLKIIRDAHDENALAMFMFEFVDDFDPFNVKKSKTSVCLKTLSINPHVQKSSSMTTVPIAIGRKGKHEEVKK